MKKLLAILLALCMVFALVACSSSGDKEETAEEPAETVEDTVEETAEEPEEPAQVEEVQEIEDGGLAEATENNGNYLDVIRIGTANSTIFCGAFDVSAQWSNVGVGNGTEYLIYDEVFYMNGNGEFVSRILEDYYFPDDYTMVMVLKPDIYFSNGMQLTGRDLLYSLSLMQNSGRRSSYYQPFIVEEAELSDDGLTITIPMEYPYGSFVNGLDFAIMCAEVCEGHEDEIDWYDPDQVVGSGPYVCTEFTSNISSTYEKRDDYWGLAYGYDAPYQTIETTNFSDQSTMCIELETGGIDVAVNIAMTDYDRLQDDDSIITKTYMLNVPYILAFDITNEYLADPLVRQAMCEAIDVEALTSSVGGSLAVKADSVLGANEMGYVSGLGYEYNPEHAKELMAEAGYADGFELTFRIMGSEPYQSIAEVVNYYLGEIGITTNIYSEEMMTFVTNISEPGYTDLQIYNMTGGNPGQGADPAIHMENWYSDSTAPAMQRDYDELLDLAAQNMDQEVRAEYYAELCQLWHDNYDCLPLYDGAEAYAYRDGLFEDFTISSSMCVWILDATVAG